jgi:hypothetical protein
VVGKLVGKALYIGVDFIVYWSNLERLLVDLVWRALVSATHCLEGCSTATVEGDAAPWAKGSREII